MSDRAGAGADGAVLDGTTPSGVRPERWHAITPLRAVVLFVGLAGVLLIAPERRAAIQYESLLALLAFVAACGILFFVWLRTRAMERRFWGLVLAGTTFVTLGRLYEVMALAGISVEWLPSGDVLSGVLEIAAVLSVLSLLTAFSRFRHSSLAAQARYVVDILALCLVAAGSLEIWVIGPWYEGLGGVSVWARIVYSASPVVGAVAFVGMFGVVLGTRSSRWEHWERLLVHAMVALSVGLVLAPFAYADLKWSIASGWVTALSEFVWLCTAVFIMAGAVYRRMGKDRPWRVRPLAVLEPAYGFVPSVVMPTLQVVALLLFGLAAADARDLGARALRLGIGGWVALSIAIRTVLTVADTNALASGVVNDELTGLYNHTHMQQSLAEEIGLAVRYGEPVSVIALDIDDFSRVNAVVGHAAGDGVLASIARAIDRAVRTRDIVCRAGGDEFVVVLPGADGSVAEQVASRVLAEIRTVAVAGVGPLCASAGVSSLPAQDGPDLLRKAEAARAVSRSLETGSVVVYDPARTEPPDVEMRIRELSDRAETVTVRALAAAVDARDEATQDHSRSVARYAVMLAREIGLDDHTVLQIEYAGLLHDVGKIGMPDDLLRKSGPLTAAERERMQAHVVLGEEILQSTAMRDILPWVRHHHERWDGTGYPDGLAGEDIPLGARILALANSYDSMRSHRPHRAALSRTAALQEIDLELGAAFDPMLAERFIDAIGRSYL